MSIFSFSFLLVAYHGMYGKMVAHFVYSLENFAYLMDCADGLILYTTNIYWVNMMHSGRV